MDFCNYLPPFMNAFRYFLIRILTYPMRWLPLGAVHLIGKWLGLFAYYLLPSFRKRALSNLSLATALPLTNREIVKIAKEAMQNLMITCLEYPKLYGARSLKKLAYCQNPEIAAQLLQNKQGVVFFCAHQANWELLFLEGTSRMPGTAIGRPIKNDRLYRWVLSIRKRFGGKIITPKNAIKEGLRALKNGEFLGVVGDQGMPESFFSSSFLGRKAFTSPLPAILAYRSKSPLFFAATIREKGKYRIEYSDPIWPDASRPMQEEVPRMMTQVLSLLEESIKKEPGQWLWQHNRWKQQLHGIVKRPFRHDAMVVLLPESEEEFFSLLPHLPLLREFYPTEFIALYSPRKWASRLPSTLGIVILYDSLEELKKTDYRFKLIFNFTGHKKLGLLFKKYSALTVTDRNSLAKIGGVSPTDSWEEILKQGLQYA